MWSSYFTINLEAENNILQFRLSKESQKCKDKISKLLNNFSDKNINIKFTSIKYNDTKFRD